MKKILLILAIALPVFAYAQPKSADAAKQAIDKAVANSQKKADKAASWTALFDAYLGAYDYPTANLINNTSRTEVGVFLRQPILSTETRQLSDGEYLVDTYRDKELYYNAGQFLDFWIVTNPVVENALDLSYDALKKAVQLGATSKDYTARGDKLHDRYFSEGISQYMIGNNAEAASLFDKAAAVSTDILKKVDTVGLYYSGMTASLAGNAEEAISKFAKCIDLGYYSNGNIYSNLADAYKAAGKAEESKSALEKGFVAFPQNQAILVGLINLYIESGDDTNKLFDLLHTAQANEPGNASLFYVEGDVHKKLGNKEKAIEYFQKSMDVDPKYVYGILNIGILYYDTAVEIQEKASMEYDDAKYAVLLADLNQNLENAIEPMEKAFALAEGDHELQVAIAEYLKNIFFRFRDKSDAYMASYEKYNAIVNGQ
ncbi:MAG: tetratricopeptide repeat protein [Bacteroidales bacterium]|nr:tetratricopeptide repeat protein [Bacteroidales bacterium]